ncbi:MAG: alginate export family protein [Pseudomonadales bacterium]|nr:alginate export family protein [Pseudomonadales bacterium]MCC6528726.1 alginate export family protein [Pseudomonadales bacterium]MCP5333694.1 alginate export family protein [Pseudomonadales bacterium]HMU90007.1 alginate export family protein [Pseudomonadales bacterium]HMW14879.1 alginate export family protein [Pseudomonadales bacterium]
MTQSHLNPPVIRTLVSGMTALLLCLHGSSSSAAATSIAEAISQGQAKLNLRYRYETVDEQNKAREAAASTLRTRLNFTTAAYQGFTGQIEVDDVSAIGGETYNSTVNGRTLYPIVADPTATEVNQAWLAYKFGKNDLKYGRQRINLDNQRFVGGVAWRQNEQTFDGITLTNTSIDKLNLFYGYITNVNRIFGPDDGVNLADLPGEVHLINVGYEGLPIGKLSGYGYLLDFDDTASAALSSATYGVRLATAKPLTDYKLLYALEYASQSDHGSNPNEFERDYMLVEGGVALPLATVKLGYELLGSDNGTGFSTPLATLHAFQGYADRFLTTPANGVEDRYLSIGGKIEQVDLTYIYHDYRSDTGGMDYGNESDLVISRKFGKHYSLMLKYANYSADTVNASLFDTEKLWLMASADF